MKYSLLNFNIVSYRVTEEYNLVANPIYNISMRYTQQQGISTTSVATTTRRVAAVTYEEVTDFRGNKPSTSIADTPAASQLGTDV